MDRDHRFDVAVEWTGYRGADAPPGPRGYGREHVVRASGKPELQGSAARVFHGDADRWNPEELLLASLAQCHMLSYLYAAARAAIRVTAYADAATGTVATAPDGSGRFTEVVLRPRVRLGGGDAAAALALHDEAHRLCFIANSVAFPVRVEPSVG